MPRQMHTARGEEVVVLEQADLEAMKTAILRWLLYAGLGLAAALGAWGARVENGLSRNADEIGVIKQEGSLPVRAMREELGVTRFQMQELTNQIQLMRQTLETERRNR